MAANIQNLKPFKKGKPGGPGRPKGSRSMSSILAEILNTNFKAKNPITKELETRDVKFWIALAHAGKAMKGDMSAIKEAYDRTEGKVANILQQEAHLKVENLDMTAFSDEQLVKFIDDNKEDE